VQSLSSGRHGHALLTLSHTPNSHTTAALPLPEDASRPRIDFLVFFVDMTNAKSLSNLKTRLLKVDKDYYAQGRSCIVATRGTAAPHRLASSRPLRRRHHPKLRVADRCSCLACASRPQSQPRLHHGAPGSGDQRLWHARLLLQPYGTLSTASPSHVSSSSWCPYLRSDHHHLV
jgi:hypothetical protein